MGPTLRQAIDVPIDNPIHTPNTIRRRESLLEKLRAGLNRRLIVVQAGAGCGKTLLLTSLVDELQQDSPYLYAWLTLERLHRDRICLLEDLILALRRVHPDAGNMTLSALSKSRDAISRWNYVLELFSKEISEMHNSHSLLILDQFERIVPFSRAAETIDYLIRVLPPSFTFAISTRQPVNLPSIQNLRAEGQVWDLATADLCFSKQEVERFFSAQLDIDLSDKALEALLAKTNGWPAGVSMLGDLIRDRGEGAAFDFSGSLSDAYYYLEEQVFQCESQRAQSFLMSTALLDHITPDLGRMLAEDNEDSMILVRLERGDFFVSIDGTGIERSYRHNPVFRDFLLKKIEETMSIAEVHRLHLKIAEYYSLRQEWDETIYHLIAAEEYELASQLVARVAEDVISKNNLDTLARWIDAFPEEERNQRAWLLLYRGVVHRVNRQWELALSLYDKAAEIFKAQGEVDGLSRALWYTSQILVYNRNQRAAITTATQALSHLDPSQECSRAWIYHIMGNAHFDLGQTEEAIRCHLEAERLFVAQSNPRGEVTQNHAIGLALHRLGYLTEAQQYYLRSLSLQAKTGDVNTLCWVQAGLARLRAMRGDYSSSIAELREIAEIAQAHHLHPAETFALSCLADTYLDLGHYVEAEACCEQALVTCQQFDDDAPQIDLHLKLMEVDLRAGHPDFAREPSLSISSWIAISNLELPKIAHLLLEATVFLAERRFWEAEQRASKAQELARRIRSKGQEAQAYYILAMIALHKGESELSAELFREILVTIREESYVSFLLRDPQGTARLLANALSQLNEKEQLTTLVLRLAGIRTEIASVSQVGQELQKESQPAERPHVVLAKVANEIPFPSTTNGIRFDHIQEQPVNATMEIRFLGPMRVRHREHQITDRAWRTSKAKELFAYLLSHNANASRDELIEVLWPEQSMDSAVRNFHFTLHSLRRALEPQLPSGAHSSFLTLSGKRYSLGLPVGTWIDVEEFRRCIAEGSKLMRTQQTDRAESLLVRAIELYQGDYLADLYVDWAESDRQQLLRGYLNALRQLSWLAYANRDYDRVMHYVGAILSKDNYAEDAHRLLMQTYCELGNTAQARRQYDDLASLLQDELGVKPESATRRLYRQILEGTYERPPL